MIPELGQFALALALGLALVQSIVPMMGAARGNLVWMRSAQSTALGQLVFGHLISLAWSVFIGNPASHPEQRWILQTGTNFPAS